MKFNLFNRTSKDYIEDVKIERKKETGGKLFRTVNTISIIGIFVAVLLLVLAMFGWLQFSKATFGIVGTIASFCIGCWLMLPWVAYFEQKKHRVVSLVFIGLNVLVPLLWIICIWVLIAQVNAGTIGTSSLNFIKIVFIISLQFAVASFIANTMVRYGKTMILFQVIAYISYLYFDFYVSYALFGIKFIENEGIVFSESLSILGNKVMLTLFALSFLYICISFSVLSYKRKLRVKNIIQEAADDDEEIQAEPVKTESAEEKIKKLQNLLDKDLITQEEFDKKRQEIIDKL